MFGIFSGKPMYKPQLTTEAENALKLSKDEAKAANARSTSGALTAAQVKAANDAVASSKVANIIKKAEKDVADAKAVMERTTSLRHISESSAQAQKQYNNRIVTVIALLVIGILLLIIAKNGLTPVYEVNWWTYVSKHATGYAYTGGIGLIMLGIIPYIAPNRKKLNEILAFNKKLAHKVNFPNQEGK